MPMAERVLSLSVIRPFGVMLYCGIYALVLHSEKGAGETEANG